MGLGLVHPCRSKGRAVVADVDDNAAEVILVVHWMGGIHTEIRLPRRRRGQRNSTSPDIIAAVRLLVRIANDDLIAGILNRNKLLTGHGNRWTRWWERNAGSLAYPEKRMEAR